MNILNCGSRGVNLTCRRAGEERMGLDATVFSGNTHAEVKSFSPGLTEVFGEDKGGQHRQGQLLPLQGW